MSNKRTSAEFNDDDQTNDPTDLFQQDDKRVKLAPFSDLSLNDLPFELLEDILIKAVLLEVKSLRLAKCVWKEKADLVMRRLRTVCQHWRNILTTNYFGKKVHGIIDGTTQLCGWEILHQSPIPLCITKVAAIRDEMFMLSRPDNEDPFINVHDRSHLVNPKYVIPLPDILPVDMVACSMSNSLYVLHKGWQNDVVLRITKDEGDQFDLAPWVSDLIPSSYRLFGAVNGGLIILSLEDNPNPSAVSIYDAYGSLQCAIMLLPAVHDFQHIFGVIQKPNGNLVLAIITNNSKTVLEEIDTTGQRIRLYRTQMLFDLGVNVADDYGRIWISGLGGYDAELLDTDFNWLDLADPPQEARSLTVSYGSQYNSERNEIVCFHDLRVAASQLPSRVLTIFRFTGE